MSQLPSMHRIIVNAGYYDRQNKTAMPDWVTMNHVRRLANRADDIANDVLIPLGKMTPEARYQYRTTGTVRKAMSALRANHPDFVDILVYVMQKGGSRGPLGYWHLWEDEVKEWQKERETELRENP